MLLIFIKIIICVHFFGLIDRIGVVTKVIFRYTSDGILNLITDLVSEFLSKA